MLVLQLISGKQVGREKMGSEGETSEKKKKKMVKEYMYLSKESEIVHQILFLRAQTQVRLVVHLLSWLSYQAFEWE